MEVADEDFFGGLVILKNVIYNEKVGETFFAVKNDFGAVFLTDTY